MRKLIADRLKAINAVTPREVAFTVGVEDGRLNRQAPSRNYRLAENLKEWLAGWRQGQRDYSASAGVKSETIEPRQVPQPVRTKILETQRETQEQRRAAYLREVGRS